jgi:hypothetical protein
MISVGTTYVEDSMAHGKFNHEVSLVGPNRAELFITGTGDCSGVQIRMSEQVALNENDTLSQTRDTIRKVAKVFLSQAAASL